nr:ABC transporter ATP-binding protein [Frisingicoccus sp.]
MDAMSGIIVEHVYKSFGMEQILTDVNLKISAGKIFGIVGNNGSGKTVLMKCICGFLQPDSGIIRVNGKIVGKECDFPEDLGVIIETPGFLPNLTGYQNLKILASLKGIIGKEEIREVLLRVGLDPDMRKPVGKYSLGMRQRLGIAQAIMEKPKVLILDEPFNGLDKTGVGHMRGLLQELKGQGKAILLASHNAQDIEVLCDEVHDMEDKWE